MAAFTVSRVKGRSRRRCPVASAMALAMAAGVGPCDDLAGAEEGLARARDDMRLDRVRHGVEAQDRIARPIDAGDARLVEGDALVERPAHRLQDAALDLAADAVRVDDLAGIGGRDGADDARAPALALHLDLDREGAITGRILVTREGEAAPAAVRQLDPRLPAEALGGEVDDVAGARIGEMAQAKFDRVGAGGCRQLVHEALEREDVEISAERPERRDAQRHVLDEVPDDALLRKSVERHGVAVAVAGRRNLQLRLLLGEGRGEVPGGEERAGGSRTRRVRVGPNPVIPALDAAVVSRGSRARGRSWPGRRARRRAPARASIARARAGRAGRGRSAPRRRRRRRRRYGRSSRRPPCG